MIKKRNLDPSLVNYIDGRGWKAGLTGRAGGLYPTGSFWYVVPSATTVGAGKSWEEPFATMQEALNVVQPWDTIFCAPGNHTADNVTPINGDAPFVSLIGMRQGSLGLAAWLTSTTATEPAIEVRARGWRVSGFEFDNPSTNAGISLLRSVANDYRPDFCEIDHCLFTGGASGIHHVEGSTYIHVHDNQFDLMTGTTARLSGAIQVVSSGHQLPGMWMIEDNIFRENIWHINLGASWGFNSATIRGNQFFLTGQANTALVMLDIRGGNGSMINDNYFGCTKAEYGDDSSTDFIRTSGNDIGTGNHCDDGDPTIDISS